ncbi:MAG: phosphotransferase family protein [Aggregatilineales bacterium]
MSVEQQEKFIAELEYYLTGVTGEHVQITGAKPLAGGASRETWLLDATIGGAAQRWVLRRDLPTQMFEDALTREQEYRLMDAAYKSGVKVAQMRFLCTDETVPGSPFFIMDYVPGISIGRRVIKLPELATAREKLPEQMAEQLALIHKIDVVQHNLDFLIHPPANYTPAQWSVIQTYQILDNLQVKNPVWEWALRWAERHTPQNTVTSFVHGDFRIGNLLVTEDGLSAVIDWEFGHVGDPDEELGYVCMRDWRFGNGTQHFAGLSDRETFLQHYEQYSGRKVSRDAVTWWEILGNIRWGVICMSQANRHLSGEEMSVELASLGRRSAEMQLETLRLIEQSGF